MATYPDQFTERLLELAALMVAEESLDDTLHRIVALATRTIPGCAHASLTLQRGEGPRTLASTDDAARRCDEVQYLAGGPCVQASRTGELHHLDDVRLDGRWPEFAAAVAAEGLHAVLSIPLHEGDAPVGALNLYGDEPDVFTDGDEQLAATFAKQSAVAIANAEIYRRTVELTQHLRLALESRDVIGQAKGILMAQHRLTADAAFDVLRERSQRTNRKLRDLADDIVATGALVD